MICHVIGASGRSGAALCRALLARGDAIVPLVRHHANWLETGIAVESRGADLTEPEGLRTALADATHVVCTAHARHAAAVLAAAPPGARVVFLGSTRKFSRFPDAHGEGVRAGEAAFLASGRPGVMLHPTMIYGAAGEDNVRRLAALLRRLPVVPLPRGGAARVQPIHQSDVTAAILAALDRDWDAPRALAIGGPQAVSYADFVRAVAAAARLPAPRIVPVPAAALFVAQPLTRLPFLPRIERAELRRLLEDKDIDLGPAREALGVDPLPLARGLALTFP